MTWVVASLVSVVELLEETLKDVEDFTSGKAVRLCCYAAQGIAGA